MPDTASAAMTQRVTCGVLESRPGARWGLVGAAAGGAGGGPGCPAGRGGCAVALGLAAKYLAWRIALDAEFFALLAEHPAGAADFDAALATFLDQPAPAPRAMPSRVRGARRLLVRQPWCWVCKPPL